MISLLLPTRGRPENMVRVVESAAATATGPVEFVFYVDDDDKPSLSTAMKLMALYDVNFVVEPRIVLSEMWNRCSEEAKYDVMMHAGDDLIFQTQGWDHMVMQVFDHFKDKIVFVHGDDLVHGPRLGTHGFLHRRWVQTVGYFVPPYFSSDYNDTWLNEVAERVDRKVYLPELITEHMHPDVGKAEYDQTHMDRIERHHRDDVASLYARLGPKRDEDVRKLLAVIGEI